MIELIIDGKRYFAQNSSDSAVEAVEFITTALGSDNGKGNEVVTDIKIRGKIHVGKNDQDSVELAKWSMIENSDQMKTIYKKVEVIYTGAGSVVRSYAFPEAFVVDYTENFEGTSGSDGKFELIIRENNGAASKVAVTGGY